jgi:hypothetical protein
MDKTPLGLTRLDPAESLATDGYSFQAINPIIIDRLLRVGVYLHKHDAHARLGDPLDEPEITTAATGGQIPSDTLVATCYTVVDEYGGESLPSPIASVSTAPGIAEPFDVPAYEIDNTQGNLRNGTYYYVLTLTDDTGGETIPSPPLQVDIQPGNDLNAVVFSGLTEITESSEGATGWRMYKSTGQSRYHYIADGPAGLDSITDDGLLCADCLTEPPTEGHTNSTNSVTVTVPDAGVLAGASAFRIYLGVDGDFTSPALAGEFDPDQVNVAIEFLQVAVDTGTPPDASTTVAGAQKINPDTDILNWPWKAPVATTADLPDDAEEGDVRFVLEDATIWLFKDTSWIQYTAPPQFWKAPVTSLAELPTTGNVPGDVRVVLADLSLYIWDVGTTSWKLLSPRPVPVQDEGDDLPARGTIDFHGSGVTVTDDPDNNKTVVTVSGGGGGGGGGGPYTIEGGEGPSYTFDDAEQVRLAVRRYEVPRFWTAGFLPLEHENYSPAGAYHLVDGEMIPQSAGTGSHSVIHGTGAAQVRDGFGLSIMVDYTILSDDWDEIGLKVRDGLDFGNGGPTITIDKAAGTITLHNGVTDVQTLGAAEDYVLPEIGETRRLTLRVEKYSDADPWYLTGVDQSPTDNSVYWQMEADVSATWGAHEPHSEIYATWSATGALKFFNFRQWTLVIKSILTLLVPDPVSGDITHEWMIVAEDGGFGINAGFTVSPENDWTVDNVYGYADGGMCVMAGTLTSGASAAPAPGDLIATVWPTPTTNLLLQVITGDDDGREFGAVSIDLNGTVRWEMGRSSAPATKHPYVVLDGVTYPMNRPNW